MAAEAPALPARKDVALEERVPIMDQINPRTLELIQKSRFTNLTGAETGMALELAAHYDLDPFAGEIWATRSKGRDGSEGQLLIMVGRDGLRKVVMRNGLEMDGDVIRKNDTFRVTRLGDRSRAVHHEYEGDSEARGDIVGAWAEVWDRTGKQRGFFFAPMHEYVPTSPKKLQYSPWGSQASVMILAAAERQAARQATPLSGLLVEGEMDLNDERAAGAIDASTAEDDAAVQAIIDSIDAPEELRDRLYEAVQAQNAVLPNSLPAMKVQVLVADKDEAGLTREVEEIERLTAEAVARRERAAERQKEREEAEETEPVQDAVVVPEGEEHAIDGRAEELRSAILDLESAIDENPEDEDNLPVWRQQLENAQKELADITGRDE